MKKSDESYLLALIFTDVFCLAYSATLWFQINLPRYYPLEHTWKMLNQKGVPSMGWYGKLLFASLMGAGAVFLMNILFKFIKSETSFTSSQISTVGAVSIIIILSCMSLILKHEFTKWGVF